MLKRKDGYVLIYVLLVVILLGLFALTISSTSMRNLRAQQNSLSRMEAQYEAEGQIELFWALASDVDENNKSVSGGKVDSDAVINAYIDYIKAGQAQKEDGKPYFELPDDVQIEKNAETGEGDGVSVHHLTMTVIGHSADDSAAVQAVILVRLSTYASSKDGEAFTMLRAAELEYVSYESVNPAQISPQPTQGGAE